MALIENNTKTMIGPSKFKYSSLRVGYVSCIKQRLFRETVGRFRRSVLGNVELIIYLRT